MNLIEDMPVMEEMSPERREVIALARADRYIKQRRDDRMSDLVSMVPEKE